MKYANHGEKKRRRIGSQGTFHLLDRSKLLQFWQLQDPEKKKFGQREGKAKLRLDILKQQYNHD